MAKQNKITSFGILMAVALGFFVISQPVFAQYDSYYDAGYDSYYDAGYDSYYDAGYDYYDSYYDAGYDYNDSYYDAGYDYHDSYYDAGYDYYDSYYDAGYSPSYSYGYYDSYPTYSYGYETYYYPTSSYYSTPYTYYPSTSYYPSPSYSSYYPSYSYGERDAGVLYVTCTPSTIYAPAGSSVTWTAYANGGRGPYTYNWIGTDLNSSNSSQIVARYNTSGQKVASVKVSSGDQSMTAFCGGVNVSPSSYNY